MASKRSNNASPVYDDNEKWKKELEKELEEAGFSHIDGKRIICIDCGLNPRLDDGDSPSQIHVDLRGHCCKYAKEKLLARSETGPCMPESEETPLNAQGEDILENAEIAEAPTDKKIDKDHLKMKDIGMGTAPSPQVTISQQKPNEEKAVATVEERFEEMKNKTQCKSCFKSFRHLSYAFIPCGHDHCSDCAFDQKVCKVCKTRIEQTIEHFWP